MCLSAEGIAALSSLKPEVYVTGTDGFLRYFGAKFGEDFMVFENLNYGNAIYVLFEDWQDVSKRSRIDLLRGARDKFARIEHRESWCDTLEAMVDDYREKAL